MSANSPEIGAASVTVPCVYNEQDKDGADKPFSIAFNPRYLIEACESLESAGDTFKLNFIDELSPIKITNDGANMVVVMPMRLN